MGYGSQKRRALPAKEGLNYTGPWRARATIFTFDATLERRCDRALFTDVATYNHYQRLAASAGRRAITVAAGRDELVDREGVLGAGA